VYFFRDDTSPNDLHFEVIDQNTGKIASAGETPYHGDYSIQPPIRVTADGELVLLGSGDIYRENGLTWAATLGKSIQDANWRDDALVDVDTTDRVEIRDLTTRAVLGSYQYLGQPIALVFGTTDAYLLHVVNNTTTFLKLPFNDQDHDTVPKWWEQLYGLSDSNAADAAGDLDSDGLSNADEYAHHTSPTSSDTDSDGLTDTQEISTYHTNPSVADSDGDGLSDQVEVLTYHSDPWQVDSDDDGYSDSVEVTYGGDPNDSSVLPQAITSYTQSFESNSLPMSWSIPTQSNASWTVDSGNASNGSRSLKSGAIANQQTSSVRFRGFFAAGQFSFYAKTDSEPCCDRLNLFIDAIQYLSISTSNQWNRFTAPVTLGVHDIEWRYTKDSSGSAGADAAWIDDVQFVGN
jgi:hypothetical protein